MRSEENPFGDCVTALELIREEFKYLILDGINPYSVLLRSRWSDAAVFTEKIALEHRHAQTLDTEVQCYRDVGWMLSEVEMDCVLDGEMEFTEQDIDLMRSLWIVYAKREDCAALRGPISDASRLIRDRHDLLRRTILKDIPPGPISAYSQFFVDVVFEIARFGPLGIPVRTSAVATFRAHFPKNCTWDSLSEFRTEQPWTQE